MRVAIIIPRIDQAGPVMVIKALTDLLGESNQLEIKIFYLDKKVEPDVEFRVPVERLVPAKFRFDDFDVIHTNGIRPDMFAFLYRKKIKYHISTIHNYVFDDLKYTYGRVTSFIFGNLWLRLWKSADKLVCVSGTLRDYYLKWFSNVKLKIIYNGIQEPDKDLVFDNDIARNADEFHSRGLTIIGTACNLNRGKGIDLLISQMAECYEFAVIIIGKGKELQNLKILARKLNISDRCYFPGYRRNAVSYFKYFDIFAVPSLAEGFCLSLIEAVQQNIPVICSEIEVFKELFNSDEVIFFNPDCIGSLLSALKTAQKSGKIRTDLAYLRYQNNYTERIMANRYLDLYKTATNMHLTYAG